MQARTLTAVNVMEIAEWCNGLIVTEHDALDHSAVSPGINLRCGDEVKRASVGSVIICKFDGTFDVLR